MIRKLCKNVLNPLQLSCRMFNNNVKRLCCCSSYLSSMEYLCVFAFLGGGVGDDGKKGWIRGRGYKSLLVGGVLCTMTS